MTSGQKCLQNVEKTVSSRTILPCGFPQLHQLQTTLQCLIEAGQEVGQCGFRAECCNGISVWQLQPAKRGIGGGQ